MRELSIAIIIATGGALVAVRDFTAIGKQPISGDVGIAILIVATCYLVYSLRNPTLDK